MAACSCCWNTLHAWLNAASVPWHLAALLGAAGAAVAPPTLSAQLLEALLLRPLGAPSVGAWTVRPPAGTAVATANAALGLLLLMLMLLQHELLAALACSCASWPSKAASLAACRDARRAAVASAHSSTCVCVCGGA
jgi:hypothetical protein